MGAGAWVPCCCRIDAKPSHPMHVCGIRLSRHRLDGVEGRLDQMEEKLERLITQQGQMLSTVMDISMMMFMHKAKEEKEEKEAKSVISRAEAVKRSNGDSASI